MSEEDGERVGSRGGMMMRVGELREVEVEVERVEKDAVWARVWERRKRVREVLELRV